MKTNPTLPRLLLGLGIAGIVLCSAARLVGETLATDTVVFAQTDPKSPVLARLRAGSVITAVGEAPAGWRRVEVTGPVEAYVQNRDLTKGLEVHEGSSIYAAPRKDAQVLTIAGPNDKTDVIGLHGTDWVQIKLEKKLQGFIAIGETANMSVDNKPAAGVTTPVAPATPAAPAAPVSNLGRPVAVSGSTANMPRLFSGRLVVARRALANPNPPYDYQLTDANGRRFAYVDTKRLLLTDKIENLLNLNVNITGTVRNTVDGKDLVIAAESMQVK